MARRKQLTKENTMSDETTGQEVVTETPDTQITESNGPGEEGKREKKLAKDLSTQPGKVIITVAGGVKGAMIFDPTDYPQNVQDQLPSFGLGHKLGDAAAGRSGVEAEDAIQKVHEGLLKGDWTVRAPAVPKVSLKDVATNFAGLTEEEKAEAAKLMAALGIKIPGITA